jgi:hypothetical protein
MNLFDVCFASAPKDGIVEFSINGVHKQHRQYQTVKEVLANLDQFKSEHQAYFAPALRKTRSIGVKENVAGTCVCWVDADYLARPVPVLPATALVHTGHGWHVYWALKRYSVRHELIEAANQSLQKSIEGDSTFDVSRLLRIPGTYNTKEEPYKLCELIELHPERVYSLKSLYLSGRLDKSLIGQIVRGNQQGFASRSERDWSIVKELIDLGFTEADIFHIFGYHSCGDKFREPNGTEYLQHTIKRAQEAFKKDPANTGMYEKDDTYRLKTKSGSVQLSTFVLEPKMLLQGDDEDSFMCNVRAKGTNHVWENVTIPKSAFTGVHSLSRHLTKASWVWLGRDGDTRSLQAHLVARLQEMGVPRAHSVSTFGRHTFEMHPDRKYFVARNAVLGDDGSIWTNPEASPVVYVDPDREVPQIELILERPDNDYVKTMAGYLRNVNEPKVFWPMLGWFAATTLKPSLEEAGYRFPTLNVSGTRGSGKSTTIQRVFQPLLGYVEPRAYDANTTRFVTLTLLGSSKSIPVAFSEFRSATTSDFHRYVLQAYDTGRDPRGHADQTTTDYPLSAPFCVDGEDMLDDPAELERIIAVQPNVNAIREGSEHWSAFNRLRGYDLRVCAFPLHMLSLRTDINSLLDEAEDAIYDHFDEVLPSRIRSNLIVVWTGILLFRRLMDSFGVDFMPSDPEVLRKSLDMVYSTKLGRAPTAADDFTEIIVNAAAQGVDIFPWTLRGSVLWFQLSTAFEYYLGQRARRGRQSLTRGSIRTQLEELQAEYAVSATSMKIGSRSLWAYGVNIKKAYEAGLDVPESFNENAAVYHLGG